VYRMVPLSMTLIDPDPTGISRSRYLLTLNISEMTRDIATITIERQQEVIRAISNDDIFNNLDRHLIRFQGHGIFEVEYQKLRDRVTIKH